jgi:threonine dehydratase
MSIAEGLCPPSIGHACFELIRQTAAQHVLVQEEEIRGAMRALLECMKVLAEPSGATALAAALSGQIEAQGEGPLVVIVSGGNIDMERLKTLL